MHRSLGRQVHLLLLAVQFQIKHILDVCTNQRQAVESVKLNADVIQVKSRVGSRITVSRLVDISLNDALLFDVFVQSTLQAFDLSEILGDSSFGVGVIDLDADIL